MSSHHGLFDSSFTKNTYTCHLHTAPMLYYTIRAFILFFIGFCFALINDQLDVEHDITQYPDPVTRLMVSSWTSVLSGFLAVVLGTVYSWSDIYYSDKPHVSYEDRSNIIRLLGGFLGVHLASSKLTLSNNTELIGFFSLIGIGFWIFFDCTIHGFMIALISTILGILCVHTQISYGIYHFTQPNFFGIRVATPCLIYTYCICFGTLGRQMAIIPKHWYLSFSSSVHS
ncbi:hypothetical protein K7432_005185 [Basidiobolus ranarum]|uniref:Uncharacterized protein n=1 Tax=Basidiobolus ranarum TaxID=34480 RepID=A0ABR2W4E3_9FUNG